MNEMNVRWSFYSPKRIISVVFDKSDERRMKTLFPEGRVTPSWDNGGLIIRRPRRGEQSLAIMREHQGEEMNLKIAFSRPYVNEEVLNGLMTTRRTEPYRATYVQAPNGDDSYIKVMPPAVQLLKSYTPRKRSKKIDPQGSIDVTSVQPSGVKPNGFGREDVIRLATDLGAADKPAGQWNVLTHDDSAKLDEAFELAIVGGVNCSRPTPRMIIVK